MATDTFLTIDAPAKGLYKDKGSKFIALAWPVTSELHIAEILDSVRKEYYDARHHCYAWALKQNRQIYRLNDDGEPSGTAAKPIFGQIQAADLTNILVIVVRYFGGIKLGVRGLIDAYKGATADAFQNAKIVEKIIYQQYKIHFDYLSMNDVMKILKEYELEQNDHVFELKCSLTFKVRLSLAPVVVQEIEKIQGLTCTKA